MRIQLIECPRKLYYFLRGYDYGDKPVYFTFGSAWHEILHVWYSTPPELREEDPKDRKLSSEKALQAGLDLWHADAPVAKGDNSLNNLVLLWTQYLEVYPVEPFTLLPEGGETGWIWPLPPSDFPLERKYFLGGSLDGSISYPGYGVLVLEHKTAGSWLSDSYIGEFDFSPQVTGYTWYAKQLRGEDASGVLVNMASKRNAKAGKTPKFARSIQERSPYQLEEFLQAFRFDLLRFEFFWKSWTWPQTANPVNCSGGYAKAPCLFRELCKTGSRLGMLDPLEFNNISHRDKPWQPWKREGDQS
jgi:hypothetical protein